VSSSLEVLIDAGGSANMNVTYVQLLHRFARSKGGV